MRRIWVKFMKFYGRLKCKHLTMNNWIKTIWPETSVALFTIDLYVFMPLDHYNLATMGETKWRHNVAGLWPCFSFQGYFCLGKFILELGLWFDRFISVLVRARVNTSAIIIYVRSLRSHILNLQIVLLQSCPILWWVRPKDRERIISDRILFLWFR